MSAISEKLSFYMEQRQMTLPQLSVLCNIERSTLYQYLKGKRPLKNKVQLERIVLNLRLMPEEIEELMTIYEMEQMGQELYYQRKNIGEFLGELPAISHEFSLNRGMRGEISDEFHGKPGTIYGKLAVKQVVFQIMQFASTHGRSMQIYLPPLCEDLVDILEIFREGVSECRVVHIVGMEPDSNRDITPNLKQIKTIMRSCNMVPDYQALYYYGRAKERFGTMSILPGLIVTDEAALQLSADGSCGLLHTDKAEIDFFAELFFKLENKCLPLLHYQTGMEAVIGFCFEDFKTMLFDDMLEMCNGMCSMQFWSEEIIRTYLNHQVPEYEQLAVMISQYCNYVYEKKSKGHTRVMMNTRGILDFICTGIFREYPEAYFEKPLSVEDRCVILERLLSACEEGWYEFCIVEEKNFPLPGDWEIMVNRRNQATIQGFVEDECKVFACTESGMVEAIYDYLNYFSESDCVMSPEQSIAQVKHWMKEYLWYRERNS